MTESNDIDQEKLSKRWVRDNLISKDAEWPLFEIYENFETRQSKFESETVLYSINLSSNLLVSLIDGTAPAANFKYIDLMQSIQAVSSQEACCWVQVNEPDNALAIVEDVWAHTWEEFYSQDHQLESLVSNPAAEGGCSYMCLVPASRSWILVHELNPENDFTISVHAKEKFRDDVLTKLGVAAATDARIDVTNLPN
ncbi:MAG: hypothetical protein V3U65_11525 [Granulosicoccaceae bacterium]